MASSSRKGFRTLRERTWAGTTSSSLTTALEVSVDCMTQKCYLSATSTGKSDLASMSPLRQTCPLAATSCCGMSWQHCILRWGALLFVRCLCSESSVAQGGGLARAVYLPVSTAMGMLQGRSGLF